MKYLIFVLSLVIVPFTHALLPPVKASTSQELLYMLVLQNALKTELELSYPALSNTPKTGKVEIYRQMKLCDLDALYNHQKEFYTVDKSFYKNDVKNLVSEINIEQAQNMESILKYSKTLEKEYLSK